ncbi:ribosomal protein S21/MRP21 [Euzebyella marina]|uniref:Small ribosomal subunit protein bS21 n=1 Tax=Euzebyella marina TaxID=1761453 RepID=A0A3G2L8J8_9FLAO|nr:bS21 family ribosomal protein [Euzebyella marina]AYN68592.1 ribosomal protein S21/MRP21 [Euzebyella marina]
MLIIRIIPGENIDRALKRYRYKVKSTKQNRNLKQNQEFTKKSQKKRLELAKAIYQNEYHKNKEE